MKLLRLLILLLLIPIVYGSAYDSVKEILQVGETIDDNTRILELVAVNELGQATIRIDGQFMGVVATGETKNIEGVNVTINETLYVQNASERKAGIIMQVIWKHECDTDEDCNDGDACTLNYCTGYPRGCDYDDSEYDVTECKEDGCCADSCGWHNDPDCDKECVKDRDCDDSNPGTTDECTGDQSNPGICQFIPVTECINGDDFCPVGCKYEIDLDVTSDTDCTLNNTCADNGDCNDGNPATTDTCEGYGTNSDPRECVFSTITDCKLNDGVCPSGCTHLNDNDCSRSVVCGDSRCESGETCSTCDEDCGCAGTLICAEGECLEPVRICEDIGEITTFDFGGEFYCSEFGWKSVKAGDNFCKEGYECLSSTCEDQTCVSVDIIKERGQRSLALYALVIAVTATFIYLAVLFNLSRASEKY